MIVAVCKKQKKKDIGGGEIIKEAFCKIQPYGSKDKNERFGKKNGKKKQFK